MAATANGNGVPRVSRLTVRTNMSKSLEPKATLACLFQAISSNEVDSPVLDCSEPKGSKTSLERKYCNSASSWVYFTGHSLIG